MPTKTRARRGTKNKQEALSLNLSEEPLSGIAPLIQEEGKLADFTYDMVEDIDKRNLLMNYEGEIRSIVRQSLENVVRLGEIFTTIKEDILPYRQWAAWVENRFEGEISTATTHNWMNVYQLHAKYAEKYEDAFSQISLRNLYVLGRTGVEAEAKETALELVNEQKVTAKNTRRVVETYRKIKLANAGISPEVTKMLTKVEVAENPKYVSDIQKLSKTKQQEVAKLLMTGVVKSPREALQAIKEARRVEEETITVDAEGDSTEEVAVTLTQSIENFSSLSEVTPESIQVALVEAPLKYEFMDENGFHNLTKEVADCLMPGGFALITVGHKAAMFAGAAMHSDLKPIHLVCMRRQPGNTATIIGLNIASASVYMVLAYKPPYRAPRGFLVADLHTLNDTEALPGMDVVDTGLEKGFKRLLEPLLSSQEEKSAVLHHVVRGSQHFNIDSYLQEVSFEFGATQFVSVI